MHRSIFHLLGVALVATLALAGALVAPLASAAPTAQQAGTCDGSGGVYLYEGYNYTGRCLRFTQDVADLSAYNFNNATSSIRIIGDYTAVLYVDQNFSNVASAYGFDSTDLRGSVVDDNRASSLRVISGYRQTGDEICRGDGIYLYEETDYRGRCVRYTGDDSDFSDERFNNQASSVRVVGNYSATIYVDQNYGGASVTVSGNIPDLGPTALGNDRASSIRVSSGASGANACNGQDGVYLFEHPNFQGRCVRFTGNVPDLRVFGFDDTASSIRLIGGWTATLFRDLNGTGVSTTFSGDDANLADNPIGDNQATSLVASRGGTPPPPPGGNACDGQEGVYLYEHPNFQGRCLRLTSGAGDLRVFGFDDITSSIRIVGNWTATLFRDLTGSGVSQVFTQDNANLAGQPIGDNQATSVAVVRGSTPPPPPSGNACDGQEGVYLYEHPNFQGRCLRLTSGAGDLRVFGFDDITSSIRIVGNWTATLFRDLTGSGVSQVFTQDNANLAGQPIGDNQATSVAVVRGSTPPPPSGGNACDGQEGVYLYEHPNFQGRCLRLTSGAGDLRVFGFDDITSSIRIVGNWTATLFRDLTGSGASSVFTRDDPNLLDDAVGDNQATSVAVVRGGAAPPPPPPSGGVVAACDGQEGVYLYEGTNYSGACIRVTGDIADLRPYNLNDATSSVRVFGRWTVVLFRDLNYSGISSTFTESDPDLRNDGIGSNEATSVVVRRR